jgi:hypothetical protein
MRPRASPPENVPEDDFLISSGFTDFEEFEHVNPPLPSLIVRHE